MARESPTTVRRIASLKNTTVVLVFFFGIFSANAGTALTLTELLNQASTHYPALQASRLNTRAALEDLTAARRLHWPTVSAVVESNSNQSPTPVTNRSLQIEQTLWDAGNIKAKIAESHSTADVQALRTALLQEEVFLQLVNAWQNMLAASDRMHVAEQTINRLQAFQQQMQRRVDAEASARIELALANSRILQTQVEYSSAQNNLRQALNRITQYTGRHDLQALLPGNTKMTVVAVNNFSNLLKNKDWHNIIHQHPSVVKAQAETIQSQTRLDQKRAETWPLVYARISQPLYQPSANFATGPAAFVGLRYQTSPGFANQLQAKALATRVASTQELVNGAITDLRQALQADQDEFTSAATRTESLDLSVQGSELVLESYQRQFHAGKKTWQELLNAVRELTQNQYALGDARAALQGAMHRLQIRTGQVIP